MKNIKQFITESHKTYPWKIGIAGDLPEGCEDTIKRCMEKWTVASWTKGKKTPIQERPLDFPQLENIDVQYWDVEVRYPRRPESVKRGASVASHDERHSCRFQIGLEHLRGLSRNREWAGLGIGVTMSAQGLNESSRTDVLGRLVPVLGYLGAEFDPGAVAFENEVIPFELA